MLLAILWVAAEIVLVVGLARWILRFLRDDE